MDGKESRPPIQPSPVGRPPQPAGTDPFRQFQRFETPLPKPGRPRQEPPAGTEEQAEPKEEKPAEQLPEFMRELIKGITGEDPAKSEEQPAEPGEPRLRDGVRARLELIGAEFGSRQYMDELATQLDLSRAADEFNTPEEAKQLAEEVGLEVIGGNAKFDEWQPGERIESVKKVGARMVMITGDKGSVTILGYPEESRGPKKPWYETAATMSLSDRARLAGIWRVPDHQKAEALAALIREYCREEGKVTLGEIYSAARAAGMLPDPGTVPSSDEIWANKDAVVDCESIAVDGSELSVQVTDEEGKKKGFGFVDRRTAWDRRREQGMKRAREEIETKRKQEEELERRRQELIEKQRKRREEEIRRSRAEISKICEQIERIWAVIAPKFYDEAEPPPLSNVDYLYWAILGIDWLLLEDPPERAARKVQRAADDLKRGRAKDAEARLRPMGRDGARYMMQVAAQASQDGMTQEDVQFWKGMMMAAAAVMMYTLANVIDGGNRTGGTQ